MLLLDRLAAEVLAPLAVWVFASSLDDLLLDVTFFFLWCRAWLRRRRKSVPFSGGPYTRRGEPKIAVMIPCWAEEAVIEQMLEHNLSAVDYSNYVVWLGVYPNDPATRAKVAACKTRFPCVRYIVCPHDGPTTKADCLNWIYLGLLRAEAETGKRYDIILQHDAEDLIHPQSLRRIRRYCEQFEMIQIPVLPLKTGLREATHGTYCDFFAEFHLKELRLRAELGGFVPSAGVGTAYRREALERLRASKGGQIFDRLSLTEDYLIGLELHLLGSPQTLLRAGHRRRRILDAGGRKPRVENLRERIATRAYFPRSFGAAVRQRTRWVMGITLQSWQKFGWQAGRGQLYWLWRDRKGLISHPVAVVANGIFGYGLLRWLWAAESGTPWHLGDLVGSSPWILWLLAANSALLVWRQAVRGLFVWKVYGWRQAVTAPLRAPWANLINSCATFNALWTFAAARRRGETLQWTKTAHFYPSPEVLRKEKPRLGEVLVSTRKVRTEEIQHALGRRHWNERLGDCLIRRGVVSEEEVYKALSLQHGVPFRTLDVSAVETKALRVVPRPAATAFQAIPFRLDGSGRLWIASPELPNNLLGRTIARFGSFESIFVLITPSNYKRLANKLHSRPRQPRFLQAHAGG